MRHSGLTPARSRSRSEDLPLPSPVPPATPPFADWVDEEIAALRESVEPASANGRSRELIVLGGLFRRMRLRTSREKGLREAERGPTPGGTLRLVHGVARPNLQEMLWYVAAAVIVTIASLLVVMASNS